MPHNFQTMPIVFLLIVGGYVCFTLFAIGAKKVYFEPFSEKEEEKS